jgi:hypothetical protein
MEGTTIHRGSFQSSIHEKSRAAPIQRGYGRGHESARRWQIPLYHLGRGVEDRDRPTGEESIPAQVLYPVVIAVSVLIGAGLCFLLLLQTTREAAILRVLGTTRTAVRLALVSEPFCLSIIGVSSAWGFPAFVDDIGAWCRLARC